MGVFFLRGTLPSTTRERLLWNRFPKNESTLGSRLDLRRRRFFGAAFEGPQGTVREEADSGADGKAKGTEEKRHGHDAEGDGGGWDVDPFEAGAGNSEDHVDLRQDQPSDCKFFYERRRRRVHGRYFSPLFGHCRAARIN